MTICLDGGLWRTFLWLLLMMDEDVLLHTQKRFDLPAPGAMPMGFAMAAGPVDMIISTPPPQIPHLSPL